MADITYENSKTGHTVTYPQPNRRLEKSDTWKRVDRKKATGKNSGAGKS